MNRLTALVYVLSITATILAWSLAGRRGGHRSVAYLLTCGLVLDVARRALRTLVLAPGYATLSGAPSTAWLRVAFHAEEAMFIAGPAAMAAASLAVFLRKSPWPVALLIVLQGG
jgi:hypothetical protein